MSTHHLPDPGTVVAPPSLASSQHSPTPLELCELVVPPKRRHPKIYASGLDQQGLLLVQQMIQAIVQLPPWSISRGRKDNEKGRKRTKHEKTKKEEKQRGKCMILNIVNFVVPLASSSALLLTHSIP